MSGGDVTAREQKASCGCYAEWTGTEWRVSASSFLCDHKQGDRLDGAPPTSGDVTAREALAKGVEWLTRIRDTEVARHGVFPQTGPWAAALLAELEAVEARAREWLAWSNGQYPDDSPGDVIAYETDGTITLDDGVTTWNPLRALGAAEARVARLQDALREYEAAVQQALCVAPFHWQRYRDPLELGAIAEARRLGKEALAALGGEPADQGSLRLPASLSGEDRGSVEDASAEASP